MKMWVDWRLLSGDCTVLTLPDHLPQRYLHFPTGGYVRAVLPPPQALQPGILICRSYFVTELLGTDLHRLLTSRPLEKQFIQYFLYQILVRRANAPLDGILR